MKKLTIEIVKKEFELRNYIFCDTEYKGAIYPIKYICPLHPNQENSILLGNLRSGMGCKYCGREKQANSRRININFIKQKFIERGYTLIDLEYKNGKQLLRYICPRHKHLETKISFNSLRAGHGCKYCGREDGGKKTRISFEQVKYEFDNRKYKLLDFEYYGNHIPLRYICPEHPEYINKITLDSLKLGNGCPYCAGNIKYTIEYAIEKFKECGYLLLEKEYINGRTPMRYQCSQHIDKETKISLSNLKRGERCPYCYGNVKHTLEETQKEFNKYNYILLEDKYHNSRTYMRYKCMIHPDKENKLSLGKLKAGDRCPYCFNESLDNTDWNYFSTIGKDIPTNEFFRKLEGAWIQDSFVKNYGRCILTNQYANIVHHATTGLTQMVKEAHSKLGITKRKFAHEYTREEWIALRDEFLSLHIELGIPLQSVVHDLYHKEYGRNDVTRNKWDNFVRRWYAGEFVEQYRTTSAKRRGRGW